MGEVTLEMLQTLMLDIQAGQRATDGKIGALAESMVSLRRRIDDIAQEVGETRLEMRSLRADVRMIAVAVDQHTARLDQIEKRPDPTHT